MKKSLFAILAVTLLFSAAAMAQNDTSNTGVLTVTANLQSSIYLTLENGATGPALTGAGTPAATLALGNVSAYGPAPESGVTLTLNGSPYTTSFTLATNFGVKVGVFNIKAEAGYSLTAALGTADATNTWVVDSVTLGTTAKAVTGGGVAGVVVSHPLTLQIPQTEAAGPISNTINLVATAS